MLEEGELCMRELWERGDWVGVVVESLLQGMEDVVERR